MRLISAVLLCLVMFSSYYQLVINNDSEMKHLIYRSEVSDLIYEEVVKEMNEMFLSPSSKSFRDIEINSDSIGYSLRLHHTLHYNYAESFLDPYVSMYKIKTYEPIRTFWELPTGLDNSKVYDTSSGTVLQECVKYSFRYIPTKYNYQPSSAIHKQTVAVGDVVKSSPNEIVFLTDGKTFAFPVLPNNVSANTSLGYYSTPLVSTSVTQTNSHGAYAVYQIKLDIHNLEYMEIKFEESNVKPTVNGRQVENSFTFTPDLNKEQKLLFTNEVVLTSEFLPAIKIKHKLVSHIDWNTENTHFPLKSIRWDI